MAWSGLEEEVGRHGRHGIPRQCAAADWNISPSCEGRGHGRPGLRGAARDLRDPRQQSLRGHHAQACAYNE